MLVHPMFKQVIKASAKNRQKMTLCELPKYKKI